MLESKRDIALSELLRKGLDQFDQHGLLRIITYDKEMLCSGLVWDHQEKVF